MTPPNAFETHVGHFWGLLHTRDYMRARFFLADYARWTSGLEGVQEGLAHMMDMLRLCRGDNLGVRQIVPALMLQLDQDQECYDFVKWYQTQGRGSDYDWGDMHLPFLDVKNADVVESTKYMAGSFGDVHHLSATMLLKIKILTDVINVRLTRKDLDGKLPVELWQEVELAVIWSPLTIPLTKKSSLDLVGLEGLLTRHIKQLGASLGKANDNVIMGLLSPDDWLTKIPQYMSPGSAEEMSILLQHSFAAWWETEGALDLLGKARRVAAAGSECEIDDMVDGPTFQEGEGSYRTREEFLEDVSVNRIWGYLDDAVKDAGSLDSERPSDVHLRKLREMSLDDD